MNYLVNYFLNWIELSKHFERSETTFWSDTIIRLHILSSWTGKVFKGFTYQDQAAQCKRLLWMAEVSFSMMANMLHKAPWSIMWQSGEGKSSAAFPLTAECPLHSFQCLPHLERAHCDLNLVEKCEQKRYGPSNNGCNKAIICPEDYDTDAANSAFVR